MRLHVRLWFRQQHYRLLDRFSEVRELRKLRTDFEQRCREVYAKELEQRNHAAHADIERAKAERQLADANRALEVMTEARLNSDRAVDVLRGQLEVMAATHASEILRMQQMTDWFGLEGRGRQVFGTAPLGTKPKETDDSPGPSKILGRHVVQQQTAAFLQQAEELMKNSKPLPNSGPEYSSTSRAVADPVIESPAEFSVSEQGEPPVWEKLEKRQGEWAHVGFVREGTAAWHSAMSAHNIALRSPAGEIQEGVR